MHLGMVTRVSLELRVTFLHQQKTVRTPVAQQVPEGRSSAQQWLSHDASVVVANASLKSKHPWNPRCEQRLSLLGLDWGTRAALEM